MAKGGNNKKSNGSRLSKPYDVSNSFVKKVASRVSGYLGGWFGTPSKQTEETSAPEFPCLTSHEELRNVDSDAALPPPSKRIRIASNERHDFDFPISPIPSTSRSGLLHTGVNHVARSEDFLVSVAGPSGLQSQDCVNRHPSTIHETCAITTRDCTEPIVGGTDMKLNGAADDNSDSSESTSGCSSLVPQSDRLSQSAFACSSRKQNLEDKLSYARQLKQSRNHMYLNRSIPVQQDSSRKHNFDVSAYGSQIFNKSAVKEKMVTSPFYTGQTSYGGAAAYRRSRQSSSLQGSGNLSLTMRRGGMQVQVKPASRGSTEDLSNMSHTAKRILEALEQFSTPVSDAKRWPVSSTDSGPAFGSKRKCVNDSRLQLATPKSPLNPHAGPITTGLSVPTVPDLLKLRRLEQIQNSTAAARRVAMPQPGAEYQLPKHVVEDSKEKQGGKIPSTRKGAGMQFGERQVEVVLPKVNLPITTLPKFDLGKLPMIPAPETKTTETREPNEPAVKVPTTPTSVGMKIPAQTKQAPRICETITGNSFVFSSPIDVSGVPGVPGTSHSVTPRTTFTFSEPATPGEATGQPLTNFMSAEAVAKLKRKSSGTAAAVANTRPAKELRFGSVTDILGKNAEEQPLTLSEEWRPPSGTWECATCLIRNSRDAATCAACSAAKPGTEPSVVATSSAGFGEKFKPASGSWSCSVCLVVNQSAATKCIACETDKPGAAHSAASSVGFGDAFKKKTGQWDCAVCMVVNKDGTDKCVACETPNPSAAKNGQTAKVNSLKEAPKFNFGLPPGGCGFTFGIPPAAPSQEKQTNGPVPAPQVTPAVSTSAGLFTFGIPVKDEAAGTANSTPVFSTPEKKGFSFPATDKKLSIGGNTGSELEKLAPESLVVKAGSSPVKPFTVSTTAPQAPQFSFGGDAGSTAKTNLFALGQSKSPALSVVPPDVTTRTDPPGAPAPFFQFKTADTTAKPKPSSKVEEHEPSPFGGTASNSTTSFRSVFKTNGPQGKPFGEIKGSPAFGGDVKPPTLFGGAIAPPDTSSPFGSSAAFNGPAPVVNAFGLPATATKSEAVPAFGAVAAATPSPAFNTTSSLFGAPTAASAAPSGFGTVPVNTASTFGGFGTASSGFSAAPTFGSSSAPVVFGSAFPAASTPAPVQPAVAASGPFVFGAKASTSGPVAAAAPSLFTFGAAKPESKPLAFGSVGQNGPSFSFGAPQTAPSFFGAPAAQPPQAFGNAFGQSNVTDGVSFGTPKPIASNTPFQFSATPSQPASAPAGTGFSLSVPSTFNFTGGQTPSFSAEPSTVSSHTGRRVIKATRRTHR